MFIDKAVKKQNASYSRFNVVMIFIFILLPIAVFGFAINKLFILILILLEVAIIACMVIMKERMTLKYTCEGNILNVKQSLFKPFRKTMCDKIKLVHTENKLDDIEIVLVTNTRIGNRNFRLIGKSFVSKYPMAAKEYKRLKTMYPNTNYFYTVIKNGGLSKFYLLDDLYRSCVTAVFTEDAIENIKIARSQKEFKDSKKR